MATILVVEDFPPISSLLALMLRRCGHYVVREQSVLGALGLNQLFRFAVLDIDLPDGNGVTLAIKLLERCQVEHVVFFTATSDSDTLARAGQVGRVLSKNDGLDCVVQAIDALIEHAPERGVDTEYLVSASRHVATRHDWQKCLRSRGR